MKQMFQKGAPVVDFDMIIGQSSSVEGDIKSGGSIRIDGHIKGDIKAEGDVIIGAEADVHGNVHAASIELSGKVEGNIHSNGLLKIHSSGVLRGDIEVMSFVIEEGGAFEGLCNINTTDLPPKRETAEEKDASKDNPEDQIDNNSNNNQNQNKNNNNRNNRNNKNNNNNQKTA